MSKRISVKNPLKKEKGLSSNGLYQDGKSVKVVLLREEGTNNASFINGRPRRNLFYERMSIGFRRNYFLLFIFSSTLMVLLSWYRAHYAGTLIVDGHNFNKLPETLGFWVYMVALSIYSLTYYFVWERNKLNISQVKRLAYLVAIIFSFMLPMLSNDIFSVIAYGDASNHGIDVYTQSRALYSSVYFAYVSKFWQNAPCVYGPVVLIGARLAAWIADGNMMLAIIAYKVICFCWAIVFIEVASKVSQMFETAPRKLFFILLSPFFMIQGLAQQHCDAIAATLALCGIYFVFTHRWYLAFAFAALCVAVKINYVLVLPFLIIGLYLQGENWKLFFRRAPTALLIYFTTLVLVYATVYTSTDTFTIMFKFVFDRAPSKSLAELFGGILYYVPHVLRGDHQAITDGLAGKISDEQLFIWGIIKKLSQGLALISMGYIMFRFWFGERDLKQWFRVYVRLLLLFMLVFSHIFFAWYLVIFLPFMWMAEDKEFMQWLFVLSFLVNTQDIVCALSRNSTVYFIAFALTVFSILAYIWKYRKVYIRSLGY